jgi:Ca2+-binding RTX toxin-like protein
MAGGLGNDTYVVDDIGDQVDEIAGAGNDTVSSSISYTLGANLENLTLTGVNAIDATGNSLDNYLVGNSAANILTGGDGNDTYVVGAGDTVIEGSGANSGVDTVKSTVNFTLGANVENLVLIGGAGLRGTGNDLNNTIQGTNSNDYIDGGAGADTMMGGFGSDTYVVDDVNDVVIDVNTGMLYNTDTVLASVNYDLSGATGVENLTFTGASALTGHGNALNNTFTLNTAASVFTDGVNAGTDTVNSAFTYTLATGNNIENLTLTGSANINATGNELDNVLRGNSGINTLTGGLGNDTYYAGAGDTIVEFAGEGTDTVMSSVSYSLVGTNLENLTLTGNIGHSAIGNDGNNVITGSGGSDYIDGGAGADTMMGGVGGDTYVVDNIGDVVIDIAPATAAMRYNTDTVLASVSFDLSGTGVENLVLTGSAAINGTGSAQDNVLTGNSGINTLTGGLGDDTYDVSAGDTVVEFAGEGVDTVRSDASWTLGANLENLTLTGSAAIDGTGNALDNVLRGSANSASNILTGLDGNDTYYVGAGDSVVEGSGVASGIDTVYSSASFTLGANVENLTLTGSVGLSGTGNGGDNVIIGTLRADYLDGGAGNDRLAGGAGADLLYGGSGNDTFVFNTTPVGGLIGGSADTIGDYSTGADHFELSLASFSGIGATGILNALAFGSGAGMTAAATVDQHIVYDTTSGTCYYDADGAGGAASIAFANFAGATPVLANTDFVVV